MSVAPANAPNGGKLSTSASGCKHAGSRLRESHREPVYAIAFNQVDASLATTFATVAAAWTSAECHCSSFRFVWSGSFPMKAS